MSHKKTSLLVLVTLSVVLVTLTLLPGDQSTELKHHDNSEPLTNSVKPAAIGDTRTTGSATRYITVDTTHIVYHQGVPADTTVNSRPIADDTADVGSHGVTTGTTRRIADDTTDVTSSQGVSTGSARYIADDTIDNFSSQEVATGAARYIGDDAADIMSSEDGFTGTASPKRQPFTPSTDDGRYQNRTIVQLQSQKVDEIFDSINSRMDEIKVLRQDVDGKIVPADKTAVQGLQRKLLKNLQFSDDTIDDFFFGQGIEEEPYLEDWGDVPRQLKKYAPVVFKTVPKKMDPAFKTPCWNRRGVLKCLPYFYILGMTKCGTSDLWNKTVLHPQIMGTKKEVHWWTHRFDNRWSAQFLFKYTQRALGVLDYPSIKAGRPTSVKGNLQSARFMLAYTERALIGINIPNATTGRVKSHEVLGDGSPSTLWNNKYWRIIYPQSSEPPYINADVIATVTPGAKLIIILRDPVERLYSSYYFFQRKKPSPEEFDRVVHESVMLFERCMKHGSLRACTYQSGKSKKPYLYPTDFTGGLYHVYLEDWMRLFPREQLLILELTDWHENCEENLAKVYDLLELDFVSENFVQQSCSQPTRMRSNKRQREPMLNKTRRYLEGKYQPYNDRLYELLGDKRFDWRYNRRRS